MIRAVAEEFGIRLRGHAGSGEPGRDLICAGVSALVLALREGLAVVSRLCLVCVWSEGWIWCLRRFALPI